MHYTTTTAARSFCDTELTHGASRDRTDRLYSVLKQTLLKDVVNPEDPTPPSPSPDTPDLTSLQPAGPWAVTCAAKECEHVRGSLIYVSFPLVFLVFFPSVLYLHTSLDRMVCIGV